MTSLMMSCTIEYPINPGCWRQVAPSAFRAELFHKRNGGKFSGQFAERCKTH